MKTKFRSFSLTILMVLMFAAVMFANALGFNRVFASANTNAARIGDTYYATLTDAIDAANVGDTVVFYRNITNKKLKKCRLSLLTLVKLRLNKR